MYAVASLAEVASGNGRSLVLVASAGGSGRGSFLQSRGSLAYSPSGSPLKFFAG